MIETARDERRAEGAALAARLGLPVLESRDLATGSAAADLYLVVDRDGLQLAPAERGRERPGRREQAYRAKGVCVDFGGLDTRTGAGGLSRKQPIARAIGAKTRTVVDATAGMGQDARLLAAMGFEVTAIERSPVVAALLSDGLARAEADPLVTHMLGGRLRVIAGDARTVLAGLDPAPDAVYIDPMFPPRRKESALARKPMRLLRTLVGPDPDAAELLAAARAAAVRVVVKRPPDADPVDPGMSHCVESKLARYDVYVRGAIAP